MQETLLDACPVILNFITEKEEANLLAEIEPHMKRLPYEKDHWDDVDSYLQITPRINLINGI